MIIKRAFDHGAESIPVFHHANYLAAALFSVLIFFETAPIRAELLYQPAIVALTIFLGAWFTFAAIRIGDVSLVTPLLGVKVIAVAATSVLLTGDQVSPRMWIAAGLAAAGIFALSFKDMRSKGALLPALGLSLLSAGTFGVSDVLLQKWAADFGPMAFIPIMSWFVAFYSIAQGLLIKSPIPKFPATSRKWVWISNFILATQGLMMAIALAFFNDATHVNIVYSSRGLWGIVLVWMFGNMMGLQEARHRPGTMIWRLAGATLVTIAIILAVFEHR
ncbi:MAG: drug/metabolite transporter (DMT)-like permease [Verrucomicrobiales bacterium]|jgi:drug/metabolite transporter (DMT)-like permease